MPKVTTSTHPLLSKFHQDSFYEGMTLEQIVNEVSKKYKIGEWLSNNIYVELDGIPIPKGDWDRWVPDVGQHISVKFNVPEGGGGGGGKNPLATLLSIVVVAVAIIAAPYIAPAFTALGASLEVATSIAQFGIITAGSLLVNAIVPNKPLSAKGLSYGNTSESKIYSITGMQNQERPYGALPVVLGKVRFAPFFGAKSYSEIRKNDQYLHACLLWGYGPLEISDIRNGDTLLSEYEDVQIATNQGYPSDEELDLYPDDIFENYISSVLRYDSPVIRTSVLDVDALNIDLVFGRGLVHMTDQAKRTNRTVKFQVEWKKSSETEWNNLSEGKINPASFNAGSVSVFGARMVLAYLDRKNMQIKFATYDHARASNEYWFGTIDINNPKNYFPWVTDPIACYKFSAVSNLGYEGVNFDLPDYTGFASSASYETRVEGTGFHGYSVGSMTLNIEQGIYMGDQYKKFSITGATSQPLQRTIELPIYEKSQYDIKITRLTEEPSESNTTDYDECTWSVLRNIKNEDPVQFPVPVGETQLIIKATDQLNGNLKNLNGIVHSICPDYDSNSDTWILDTTNNPASLMYKVLQSPANASAVPDSRIDLEAFEEFHTFCENEGFTYNRVIDGQTSVWSILVEVAAAGRAIPALVDNKWTVIIDRERTEGPVQMFTPANSWGFSSKKSFVDDLHGYRCQFNNEEKDYQEDEVYVYAQDYSSTNASRFEAMEFAGVTNVSHIQKLAMYHLAVRKYRPELFTWNADFEHMVCARGDLVTISHYVLQVGFESGRVKAVDGLTVTLDQEVTLEPGKEYAIRVRNVTDQANFGTRRLNLVSVTTTSRTITLVNEVGSINITEGDLFTFGILGKESIEVIITGKTPNSDNSATLTGVQYSWTEIDAYLNGEQPPYNSGITKDAYDVRPVPPTPVIISITSDESMMILNDDGTLQSRLALVTAIPSGKVEVANTQAQISIDGGSTWYQSPDTDGTKPFIFSDVQDGIDAILRVRTVTALGVTSEWVTANHTVIGRTSPPSDITSINYNNTLITWEYDNPPIDLKGFRVKTSTFEFATWDNALEIPAGLLSEHEYTLPNTYGKTLVMVKPVDVAGNESINFASIVIDAGDPFVENVVVELLENPEWNGDISGAHIVDGSLIPLDTTLALMPKSATALMPKNDIALQMIGDQMIYSYKIWVKPEYIGNSLTIIIDADNTYKIEYRQVTYTDDLMFSPADDLMFSPADDLMFINEDRKQWLPWLGRFDNIQDITYYEFRITFEGGKKLGSEVLRSVKTTIDVIDVFEIIQDFDVPIGGARLPITKSYIEIKTVNLTLENAGSDNAISVKLKDRSVDGPMVITYDSNGNSVTGRVTATVQGY